MPEVTEEALHVYTLAGSVWLSVPRADAEKLRAADLRHRLSEVVAVRAAPGISEGRLWLTIGARTVDEHDVFKAVWPEHGGDLVVQLTIRRTREDDVQQAVLTLLNQEIPADSGKESCKTVVDGLASIELRTSSELKSVVQAIHARALADPSHCEYYAEVLSALRGRYPAFPPDAEGDRPVSLRRTLLDSVQIEYERVADWLNEGDKFFKEEQRLHVADDGPELKSRTDKMLANMKFMVHLSLRRLVPMGAIGKVMHDLVGIREAPPEEYMIECACSLMRVVGFALDESRGRVLMSKFAGRLQDLKLTAGPDGRTPYSERIQFQIQAVLDLRNNGWQEDTAIPT